jgi:hypothetical protein
MPFGNAVGEGFVNGIITKITVADLAPGDGIFVYAPAVALGDLIASITAASGTDDGHGNPFVEGIAAYVTTAGKTYALQLGGHVIGGVTVPAFFIHDLTDPPFTDPAYGVQAAGSTGCIAEVASGASTAGAVASGILCADSVASGVAGGTVEIVAGQTILNSAGGPIPAGAQTLQGAAPAAYNQAYTQSTVNRVNTIINQLQAAGITN